MDAKKRNNLLFVLVQNYVLDKKKNKVWHRESDVSWAHSQGMLQGACMAFDCEIVETETCLQITTRKGKVLLTYPLIK